MILTEEDARKTRCCGPPGCGNARVCIASECMAWRWQMISDHRVGAYLDHEGAVSWLVEKGYYTKSAPPTARGYCGLAGKL